MDYLNIAQYNFGPFAGRAFALIGVVAIWSIIWKGLALWKSARRGESVWFVVLLLINTMGILEILYIYVFSRKEKSN